MRRSLAPTLVALSGLTAIAGCSLGGSPAGPDRPPATDAGPPTRDAGPPPFPGFDGGAIVIAADPPPPISGGTLAVSPDGTRVVAADPELDAIFVIDPAVPSVLATIDLAADEEPGRVAIDGARRAHVALRGGAAIADVDLATGTLIGRRDVCRLPRGIAWRASDDTLHVACGEGLLVTLPAAGGAPTRTLALASTDLRDVVVHGDELWITRFRAATLLRVDAAGGAILGELAPAAIPTEMLPLRAEPGTLDPAVAWRAIPTPEGGALMLHQRALSSEFEPEAGYGRGDCASIVQTAMSSVDATGAIASGPALGGVVLGVDVAISPDGSRIAIASPAAAYARGLPPDLTISRVSDDVTVFDRGAAAPTGETCRFAAELPWLAGGGAAIAVAFLPDGRVIAQTRAPAQLLFEGVAPAEGPALRLSERDAYDTGHALFHARASGGLACASCHPEGGDDARVWRFRGIGPRRTQTIRGGLRDTAPFHWDGDMIDLSTLMHRVFEGRMGGVVYAEEEIDAFAAWMHAQPAMPRPAITDEGAVARGRALFEDPTVACASCHSGPALTNSVTVDVGTGSPLQVPTLVGVVHRAPYMHDGCAPTLRDRFGPCGGGDAHGRTSHLTSAQLDDLVAYLRTL